MGQIANQMFLEMINKLVNNLKDKKANSKGEKGNNNKVKSK